MSCISSDEKIKWVDMIAQAVVDRIEERERINRLADVVVARVITIQQEEAATNIEQTEKGES